MIPPAPPSLTTPSSEPSEPSEPSFAKPSTTPQRIPNLDDSLGPRMEVHNEQVCDRPFETLSPPLVLLETKQHLGVLPSILASQASAVSLEHASGELELRVADAQRKQVVDVDELGFAVGRVTGIANADKAAAGGEMDVLAAAQLV